MALCKDKTITTLNKFGYDIVRYPKSDINPLDIIVESSDSFVLLTSLPKIWTSKNPVPAKKSGTIPGLNIIESSQLKGSIGIKAIIDILHTGLDISGTKNKSINLIVQNPRRLYCDLNELANYIRYGDINYDDAATDHFFDDKKRIYIINEVIAADELKIIIKGTNQAEAELAASEITENLKTKIGAGTTTIKENEIYYKNKELVIFGFKQSELIYEDGWKLKLPSKPGNAYLGKPDLTLLAENSRIALK